MGGLKEIELPSVATVELMASVTLWGALDEHTGFLARCTDSNGGGTPIVW